MVTWGANIVNGIFILKRPWKKKCPGNTVFIETFHALLAPYFTATLNLKKYLIILCIHNWGNKHVFAFFFSWKN